MNKIWMLAICGLIILMSAPVVYGSSKVVQVFIDQHPINFNEAVAYIDTQGVTMVPLREYAAQMNYTVNWDQTSKSIEVYYQPKDRQSTVRIAYRAGQRWATLAEAEGMTDALTSPASNRDAFTEKGYLEMSAAPVVIDDISFVPVKSLAQHFGNDIAWDGKAKVATVSTSQTMHPTLLREPPEEAQPPYIGMEDGGYYFTQDEIPSGGCVLSCLAMITSNINGYAVTPSEMYAANGYTVYYNWGKLDARAGITNQLRQDVSGQSAEDKKTAVISTLTQYPNGTMLSFVAANGSKHSVVATGYDQQTQTIYVSDPRYGQHVPLAQSWVGERMISSTEDIQFLTRISAYN